MPWTLLVSILFELLRLLPSVLKYIKEHPKATRKDVVHAFPDEVKGLIKKLKDKREGVGSAPDLVG